MILSLAQIATYAKTWERIREMINWQSIRIQRKKENIRMLPLLYKILANETWGEYKVQ